MRCAYCALRGLQTALLQLNLDKTEFERVGVDDVVRDAFRAGVGNAGLQLYFAGAFGFFKAERAGGDRNYDIVVRVHMVPGFGAGGEAPLGDDDTVSFDLWMCGGFHGS
jgi:hypothetical protein